MSLDQFTNIAEIIAAFGILISLALVLRQMRQTQAQLERVEQGNMLANATASREFPIIAAQDTELADVIHRGRNDIENLQPAERRRYYNWLMSICIQTMAGNSMGWEQFRKRDNIHEKRMWNVYHMQIGQTVQSLECDGGREFITRFGYLFAEDDQKLLLSCAGLGPVPEHFEMPEGVRLPKRRDLIEGNKWFAGK